MMTAKAREIIENKHLRNSSSAVTILQLSHFVRKIRLVCAPLNEINGMTDIQLYAQVVFITSNAAISRCYVAKDGMWLF